MEVQLSLLSFETQDPLHNGRGMRIILHQAADKLKARPHAISLGTARAGVFSTVVFVAFVYVYICNLPSHCIAGHWFDPS